MTDRDEAKPDWADDEAEQTIKSLKGMRIPAWEELPSDGIIAAEFAKRLRKVARQSKAEGMREAAIALEGKLSTRQEIAAAIRAEANRLTSTD